MTDPISKVREALEMFVSHYQCGVSPMLDEAWRHGNVALSTLPPPMTEAELVRVVAERMAYTFDLAIDQQLEEQDIENNREYAECAIRALAARGLLAVKGE